MFAGEMLGSKMEDPRELGRGESVLVGSFEPAHHLPSSCDFLCQCLLGEDNLQLTTVDLLILSRSWWVRSRNRSRTGADS